MTEGSDATPIELPTVVADALSSSPNDVVVAIGPDLQIAWVSESARTVLGWDPADLIGLGAFELLHPDEIKRAVAVAAASAEGFAPRSIARYRVMGGDGSWNECDLSVAALGTPEEPRGLSVWIRLAYDQLILRETLSGLLSDAATDEVLAALLGLVFLRNDVSRCAISYLDGYDHWVVVGSDLPDVLVGDTASGRAEPSPGGPWWAARHELTETVFERTDDLPDDLATTAEEAGVGGLWVSPITNERGEWVATVTIWMERSGPSPRLNTYALSLIRQLTELVLR